MTLTCKGCGRQIPTHQSFSVSGKVPVRSKCECGEMLHATGGLGEESEPKKEIRIKALLQRIHGRD